VSPSHDAPSKATKAEVRRDVILVGASAGGLQAIGKLLGELPADFDGTVAVTLHRSAAYPSMLRDLLAARTKLEVIEPSGNTRFERGRVYIAPANVHLTFVDGVVSLDRGPKVRHARPSIDVMFSSGARAFGRRAVGVVLTGNLDDGVAGLQAIKQNGGLSMAQEPGEAYAPSMPSSAVAFDGVDVIFLLEAGAKVLQELVAARGVGAALAIPGTRRPSDPPLLPNA
jgi:two-component system chemotaxis response regulator CheB